MFSCVFSFDFCRLTISSYHEIPKKSTSLFNFFNLFFTTIPHFSPVIHPTSWCCIFYITFTNTLFPPCGKLAKNHKKFMQKTIDTSVFTSYDGISF